jgi:hypothetical protein
MTDEWNPRRQHRIPGGIHAPDQVAGKGITVRELLALPAVVDLCMAAKVLHVGRTTAHGPARRGEFPCPLLRIGNARRATTAHLLELAGVTRYVSSGDELP